MPLTGSVTRKRVPRCSRALTSIRPSCASTIFRTIDVGSTFPNIHFETGSFSVVDGAVGIKINLGGKLLADFNALFKLNDAGLRDTFTPLVGIEYSF